MVVFTAHKGSRYDICEKGDAWLYRNKKKSRDRNGDRNSCFKQLTGSFSPAHDAGVPSPHRQNRHTYFARVTAVVAALQVYLAVVFVNANVCFVKFYRFKNFHKHQRMSAACGVRRPTPALPPPPTPHAPFPPPQGQRLPRRRGLACRYGFCGRARLGYAGVAAARPLGS